MKITATFEIEEILWKDLSRDLKEKLEKKHKKQYALTTSDLVALKVLFAHELKQ